MNIGTQLRLGLSVILILVIALGVLSWRQTESLWSQTSEIVDHPLQVQKAVGDIKADILSISRITKDIFLFPDQMDDISPVLVEVH